MLGKKGNLKYQLMMYPLTSHIVCGAHCTCLKIHMERITQLVHDYGPGASCIE
jgi:hypothetical protein